MIPTIEEMTCWASTRRSDGPAYTENAERLIAVCEHASKLPGKVAKVADSVLDSIAREDRVANLSKVQAMIIVCALAQEQINLKNR